MHKVTTGSKILDKALNGGYDSDIITTIYGPAGSGKTILCMLCLADVARKGKKVVYIDTEGSFSVERLKQVAPDYEDILSKVFFFRPTSFEEQRNIFERLKDMINDSFGLIVIDTMAMLYRVELARKCAPYDVNKELGTQISYLSEISSKKNIPVIIANQVYADFNDKNNVNMVGGDLLRYSSKCLIELRISEKDKRRLVIRKHRSIPSQKEISFHIVEKGIIGTKTKSF